MQCVIMIVFIFFISQLWKVFPLVKIRVSDLCVLRVKENGLMCMMNKGNKKSFDIQNNKLKILYILSKSRKRFCFFLFFFLQNLCFVFTMQEKNVFCCSFHTDIYMMQIMFFSASDLCIIKQKMYNCNSC